MLMEQILDFIESPIYQMDQACKMQDYSLHWILYKYFFMLIYNNFFLQATKKNSISIQETLALRWVLSIPFVPK